MDATEVEWAALGDDARIAEIPKLLADLRSSRAQERRSGLGQLANLIAHQGWLDPVGVHAIPFLHDVALDASTKDRAPLIVFLADIAVMGDHLHLLGDLSLLDRGFFAPGTHYRAAHDAVAARLEGYLAFLGDRSPAIRGAVALLCGLMHTRAAQAGAALEARLSVERQGPAWAAMCVALGLLARGGRPTDPARLAADADDRWSRLGAACAQGLAGLDLSSSAVSTLVQCVLSPPKANAAFPWGAGCADRLALDLLIDRADRTGDVGPLRVVLEARGESEIAAAILRAMIPTTLEDGWRLPDSVIPTEREALRLSLTCNPYHGGLGTALDERGFVMHQASLVRFLGDAPAGPLDRVVDGLPLWRWVRGAMDGYLSPDELLESFDRLDEADVVAAFEDVSTLYMQLHRARPRTDGGPGGSLRSVARYLTVWPRVLGARVPPATLHALLTARARSPDDYRRFECAALLVAYHRTEPSPDALRAFSGVLIRAIEPGTHDALRPLFARLPLDERSAIVQAKKPACVRRGSYWLFHGSLPFLDLVPTPEAASLVIDATRRLSRPPLDRVAEVLRAMGEVAVPLIDAALADDSLPTERREALARGRA